MDLQVKECPECKREYAVRLAECPGCAAGRRSPSNPLQERRDRTLPSRQPGPRQRRERSYQMIDALARRGGKYEKALSGDGLALFSLIGTQDWEDYVSLAFSAMSLETALDVDARLERLQATAEKIESHLARLVELQEASMTRDAAP